MRVALRSNKLINILSSNKGSINATRKVVDAETSNFVAWTGVECLSFLVAKQISVCDFLASFTVCSRRRFAPSFRSALFCDLRSLRLSFCATYRRLEMFHFESPFACTCTVAYLAVLLEKVVFSTFSSLSKVNSVFVVSIFEVRVTAPSKPLDKSWNSQGLWWETFGNSKAKIGTLASLLEFRESFLDTLGTFGNCSTLGKLLGKLCELHKATSDTTGSLRW